MPNVLSHARKTVLQPCVCECSDESVHPRVPPQHVRVCVCLCVCVVVTNMQHHRGFQSFCSPYKPIKELGVLICYRNSFSSRSVSLSLFPFEKKKKSQQYFLLKLIWKLCYGIIILPIFMMIPVLFLLEILSIIGNVLKGLLQFVVDVFSISLVCCLCTQQSVLHRLHRCCKKPNRRAFEEVSSSDAETNTAGDLHELCGDGGSTLHDVHASLSSRQYFT